MGQPGPELPYKVIAGVIPCGSGWLVASAKLVGISLLPEQAKRLSAFADVIDERPPYSVIALGAPVGYLSATIRGGRTCDRDARALLGARRAGAVRSAPTRAHLDASTSPAGLDAVSVHLLPRLREIASEMAPYRQRTIYEVQPELSFFEMNDGRPLRYAKRYRVGLEERRELLRAKFPNVEGLLGQPVPGATTRHLLDAAACLWSARRVVARAALRVPTDPEWDNEGLRMEIVR